MPRIEFATLSRAENLLRKSFRVLRFLLCKDPSNPGNVADIGTQAQGVWEGGDFGCLHFPR